MSQPPTAPPPSARCALCGKQYPADSPHECAPAQRDAATPMATLAGRPASPDFGQSATLKAAGLPGATGSLPPGEEHDTLLGTVINERFKILRRIGKGGMGVVYKARHLTLDTNVAIKVLLHQRSKDDQERFVQEAKLASKVRHPNTVYISDFGFLPNGCSYLVMELLQGRPLANEVAVGPLSLTRALQIGIQITRGLQAVHDKGIVHRDMKPENVFLLEQDGNADFVKIVDFGIAKATGTSNQADESSGQLSVAELEKALLAEEKGQVSAFAKTETRAGQTVGTPPYMSPEQVQSLPVDPRTDQYALGCMLYEMISGELPFMAKSAVALMMKHLTVVPAKLRDRFPKLQVPEAVDTLVQRLLEKEKVDRFPSMREVEAALQHELERLQLQRGERVVLTSATARRLTAEGGRSRLLIGGRQVPLWAVLAAAAVLLVGGVIGGVQLLRPRAAPKREVLPPAELLALRAQALQVLTQSLHATDVERKLDALAALGQTHDATLRPELEAELGAASPVVQTQAAEALGQLGDRAAAPGLGALLDKSKDAMVRAAAAEGLQLLGDERGGEVLTQLLREPDADGQFRAALALAESGNKDAQSKLLAVLGRGGLPDGRRLRVLAALVRGGEPTALPTLQRLMTTPGPIELRLRAAAQLVQLGEESGRLFLREQTHKPGPSQFPAARFLAEPEEAEALKLLRGVLDERGSTPAAQLLATAGLGSGGDSLDARRLGAELPATVPAPLRETAAISVLQIAGRDPNTLAAQSLLWARGALTDRDWTVREAAVAALGDSESPAALELLRSAARDQTARVRQAAVRSLGRHATTATRDLLLAALADGEAAVRVEALRSLARIMPALHERGEANAAALQGSMGMVFASRPPLEQALAIGVLLRLGSQEPLTRLRTLLKDADPQVRRTAVEQLSAQVPEQAALLIEPLTDAEPAVRFAAARKLAAHGDKRAIPALRETLARGGVEGLLAYVLLNKLGETVAPPADLERSFAAAALPQRLEVVDTLAELPPDLALPPLRRAARDTEAAVRRRVAEVAAILRGADAAPLGVPLLRQLLNDRDGSVRARAAALIAGLLGSPQNSPELPPLPTKSRGNPDGDAADAGQRATAEPAPSEPTEEAPAAGGRGHLIIETPPGVHFQIDGGPYQTASKAALLLAAGKHLVTAISGVQEVVIKPDTTQTLHIEASQAEQLFRDGRDSFNKPDFTKASRQLEKANALCARDAKHAQACAGLTVEASFLLGNIYLTQQSLPDAMTAFQRVVDRAVNLRGKNTQKAEAQAAIKKLEPQLGRVIVTQKKGKRCQEEVIWLRPVPTQIRLNGALELVNAKPNQTIRVGNCS